MDQASEQGSSLFWGARPCLAQVREAVGGELSQFVDLVAVAEHPLPA
jgi:hypothetical protein